MIQKMSNVYRSLFLASLLFATTMQGQDASLDPTFSGNGYTVDLIEGMHDRPNSIAVQDDGRIVVCGTRVAFQDNHMLVARYTAAGALDPTFSGDGKLTVPIGFITNNTGEAVLIQPDGRILVAGSENTMDGRRMTVVRLNANGTLHTAFGTSGRATIPMNANGDTEALCMVLRSDGSIILAGAWTDQFSTALMAKVDANGTEDAAFSQAANAALVSVNATFIHDLVLLPDGRLLASGGTGSEVFILRLMPDGSLDASFGNNGQAQVTLSSTAIVGSMRSASDGRIVLVGNKTVGDLRQALIVQLDSTGTLDPGFGTGGIAVFATPENDDAFTDLVFLPNGEMIAGGYLMDNTNDQRFLFRRLDPSGTMDPTFGTDGVLLSDLTSGSEAARCMALQPDGKVLVAGTVNDAIEQFCVARYVLDSDIGWGEPVAPEESRLACTWTGSKLVITTTSATEDGKFILLDGRGAVLLSSPWRSGHSRDIFHPASITAGVYIGQLTGTQERKACRFVVTGD